MVPQLVKYILAFYISESLITMAISTHYWALVLNHFNLTYTPVSFYL